MNTLTKCTRNLKTMILAGTMLLTTIAASAQQEVAPDHFDETANTVQKVRPVTPKKQLAATHKTTAKHNAQLAKNKAPEKQVEIAGK